MKRAALGLLLLLLSHTAGHAQQIGGSSAGGGSSGIVSGTTTCTSCPANSVANSDGSVVNFSTTLPSGLTATSLTLITPTLGVANGTSLALGGATIGSNALAVTGTIAVTTSSFGAAVFTRSTAASGIGFTLVNGNGQSVNFGEGGTTQGFFAGVTAGNNFFSVTDGAFQLQSTSAFGWGDNATATSGTRDTTLSRNAAGVTQFGTTAANASGAWLAAKGTLISGTLADQAQVLNITATQPASPSGTQSAITTTITGAGSAAQNNVAWNFGYSAGYTGASRSIGLNLSNSNAGTGQTLVPTAGLNFPNGNMAILGDSNATTTGYNIGYVGRAEGGAVNAAVAGFAQINKNSATNIGVVGSGLNGGTSPVQIGGFFSLNQTTVPSVSAALIADNGSQTDAIFLARDNGSTVFTIADGGIITATGTMNGKDYNSTGTNGVLVANSSFNGPGYYFNNSNNAGITSPGSGIIALQNYAGTDFNRLQFGGTTSSFPAIKRSSALLQARLADDSAYAAFEANTLRTATAYTVGTLPAGSAGMRAYVTDQLTACAATGVALTGGGAIVCPAFYNGSAWVGG